MDKLRIRGGRTLNGEVLISGAKNAALPELCATLLSAEPVTLRNVPRLQDVTTMLKLIRNMGVQVDQHADGTVLVNGGTLNNPEAPYELVKTMRASVLALGPLLARFGHAKVSLPGGCAIGSRPVDQHLKGLAAMGADIVVEHGYMVAKLADGQKRLKGARITTDMVTVTGTENFLMAAALAEGETILENAAQEPEIPDLAEMLIKMGAKIEGHGSSRIRIQGVDTLYGANHQVVADRIETGTFLCAVAATGGDVVLKHGRIDHLDAVIDKLREAGAVQTMIASNTRWALMTEHRNMLDTAPEPSLNTLLTQLDADLTDLVLVEGFRHEAIPKIEVFRASLGQPLLAEQDSTIIAIASDTQLTSKLPLLDLNNIEQIANFVTKFTSQ